MESKQLFEHESIDKYSFDEIPLNQDCMLMSEQYMEEFSAALIEMLRGGEVNPYEVGYVGYVSARKINANSIDMSWYPNVNTRFHEVSISIPKDKIKTCVDCWQYDIRPYIFIDHEWLENLYMREYCVFALVDAIGVKKAMRENLLNKENIIRLRDMIDALAEQQKNISFHWCPVNENIKPCKLLQKSNLRGFSPVIDLKSLGIFCHFIIAQIEMTNEYRKNCLCPAH